MHDLIATAGVPADMAGIALLVLVLGRLPAILPDNEEHSAGDQATVLARLAEGAHIAAGIAEHVIGPAVGETAAQGADNGLYEPLAVSAITVQGLLAQDVGDEVAVQLVHGKVGAGLCAWLSGHMCPFLFFACQVV